MLTYLAQARTPSTIGAKTGASGPEMVPTLPISMGECAVSAFAALPLPPQPLVLAISPATAQATTTLGLPSDVQLLHARSDQIEDRCTFRFLGPTGKSAVAQIAREPHPTADDDLVMRPLTAEPFSSSGHDVGKFHG